MFGFGKYTRSLLRIIFYSIGLTLFLQQRWINPDGDFLNNVIAGIALYMASWFAAYIAVSFVKGQGTKTN